jgi:hypothetical protein
MTYLWYLRIVDDIVVDGRVAWGLGHHRRRAPSALDKSCANSSSDWCSRIPGSLAVIRRSLRSQRTRDISKGMEVQRNLSMSAESVGMVPARDGQ